MTRFLSRFLLLLVVFLPAAPLVAEKVSDLPLPTHYVNDFAHALTPAGQGSLEDLCLQVHTKANAELVVVTIKTLDDGASVEEFTAQLEEKWKLGKKGEDRSAILLLVLNPHKLRIETGYGLEGILNDARVGAIIDLAIPQAKAGDYDGAMMTEVQGMASVIAADAHVTLTPTAHRYHRESAAPPARLGIGQIVLGVGAVLLLIFLASTGNLGWAFVLLNLFLGGGGGGGGGGRDDDDRGGGFGGSGGGASGGGGASRDF